LLPEIEAGRRNHKSLELAVIWPENAPYTNTDVSADLIGSDRYSRRKVPPEGMMRGVRRVSGIR